MINAPTIINKIIIGVNHHAFLTFKKDHSSPNIDLFGMFCFMKLLFIKFVKKRN